MLFFFFLFPFCRITEKGNNTLLLDLPTATTQGILWAVHLVLQHQLTHQVMELTQRVVCSVLTTFPKA